jgi:DNA-binding GntR family transcriptional regulator
MMEKTIPTIQRVVVDSLRQSILDGSMKPGERLVQDDIATQFGVSRIPIREAFRTLAAEGLVTFEQRRGIIVTELSRDDIEEILSVRAVLEGMACRAAAECATSEQLEVIHQELDDLNNARNEPEQYYQFNYAFHEAILSASNRPHTAALVKKFRNMIETVARLYLDPAGRVEIVHTDHQALYEAIANHDADEAERLAIEHTRHVLKGILADWKDPEPEPELELNK